MNWFERLKAWLFPKAQVVLLTNPTPSSPVISQPSPKTGSPSSSDAFDAALRYVLVDEGMTYENVPGDAGGPTKYGITIGDLDIYYGRHASIEEVKNMTLDTAKEIYRRNYWDPMHLSQIEDPRVAIALFDIGVVCGIGTAARLAQTACRITLTGKIDAGTLAAINGMTRVGFITQFEQLTEERFEAIAAAHSNDVKFLKGWLNRSKRLLTLEV